jgi:hypothetical protein
MITSMVRAIREIVTVGPDGTIKVQAPELRQGTRAEVIVLLDSANQTFTGDPLAALQAVQNTLGLTLSQAQEWADRSVAERAASSRK